MQTETRATCSICGRLVAYPYRRRIDGVITEGCVAEEHTPHVSGADAEWHNRPQAVTCRESLASVRAALLMAGMEV